MSTPLSRKALREKVCEQINALDRKALFVEFGISRLSELTNLDNIGLPVFSCIRALSKTISIHSGKGIEAPYSRCGAIMEAIEFEVAEHPIGKFRIARAKDIPADERMDLSDCFPIRSSIVNESTLLAWEEVTNIQRGAVKTILAPSDLVWMTNRLTDQDLLYFQMGSNGLASGGSLEDAILSGLYEIIERDAWTLNQFLLENCGITSGRVPLEELPPRLYHCVQRIEAAESKLHLFEITTDYRVPVFGAIILDLSGRCAGTFGGYGAHLNAETAAVRAVTEAAQARCCYISGARDDLFRRQFLLMKRMDQAKLHQMFSELPAAPPIASHRLMRFGDVKSELHYLLKFVQQFGLSHVYVRDMGGHAGGLVHVVRVFSPQCEPFRWDTWTPSQRCLSYVNRRLEELKTNAPDLSPIPEDEQGEEWKKA